MANTNANTSTILETLNTSREQTIAGHYGAAFAELQEKIKADPLSTRFDISAGCVSSKITKEIARRLVTGGINVTATTTHYGVWGRSYSLTVEVALPSHLVPPEPVKVEESKKDEIVVATEAEAATEVKASTA